MTTKPTTVKPPFEPKTIRAILKKAGFKIVSKGERMYARAGILVDAHELDKHVTIHAYNADPAGAAEDLVTAAAVLTNHGIAPFAMPKKYHQELAVMRDGSPDLPWEHVRYVSADILAAGKQRQAEREAELERQRLAREERQAKIDAYHKECVAKAEEHNHGMRSFINEWVRVSKIQGNGADVLSLKINHAFLEWSDAEPKPETVWVSASALLSYESRKGTKIDEAGALVATDEYAVRIEVMAVVRDGGRDGVKRQRVVNYGHSGSTVTDVADHFLYVVGDNVLH